MTNTQQYEEALERLTNALASDGTDELRITEASTISTDPENRAGRIWGKGRLMDSNEALIDPATEPTLAAIAAALASNGNDHLLVQEESALDVSAATVPVDTGLSPLSPSDLPLDVASPNPLDVSGATVPTEQQSPVALENVDATSSSATTSSTGSGNAAAIAIADGRTTVTAAWDVSGAATVTIEVSPDDGGTWYQEHEASSGGAETGTHTFETGFDDVRIYVDQALNSASIGAKGA